MRFKDTPVDVSRFTQRVPNDPILVGSSLGLTTARLAGTFGARSFTAENLEQVREVVRARARLHLEDVIGLGGTGVVFIAKHEELPVRRAVKVMYYAERDD